MKLKDWALLGGIGYGAWWLLKQQRARVSAPPPAKGPELAAAASEGMPITEFPTSAAPPATPATVTTGLPVGGQQALAPADGSNLPWTPSQMSTSAQVAAASSPFPIDQAPMASLSAAPAAPTTRDDAGLPSGASTAIFSAFRPTLPGGASPDTMRDSEWLGAAASALAPPTALATAFGNEAILPLRDFLAAKGASKGLAHLEAALRARLQRRMEEAGSHLSAAMSIAASLGYNTEAGSVTGVGGFAGAYEEPIFAAPQMPQLRAGRLGPEFGIRPRPGGFPGASVLGLSSWWRV